MSKLFKFLDVLPIVRILQLSAVICFVATVVSNLAMFGWDVQRFTVTSNSNLDQYWDISLSFLLGFFRAAIHALFNSAILLGMAEIIKLMKEKKEVK